ncbi:uncharacterized protein [Anoplolepis gracilipes]|uniref:uncharacterized protein n=1 Tax=Anoplolepis gracilipes TaxID=354296 RepID=UPI003BA26D8B
MEARNSVRLPVTEVVRRIEAVGLKVALQKTEAVFMHAGSHGAPPETQLSLGRDTLGALCSPDPQSGQGFRGVGQSPAELGGPGGVVRRLWCGTVQSKTLYGAPVWAERVMGDRVLRETLRRIQRPMALRAARACRTVLHRAATILAGLLPWELVTCSHAEVYRRVR